MEGRGFNPATASQFPDGMRFVGHYVTRDGLLFGVWTGPFEVTSRAGVYEQHKDWLVRNAKGDPIPSRAVWDQKTDMIYSLDTTNPAAQEYLRQTYKNGAVAFDNQAPESVRVIKLIDDTISPSAPDVSAQMPSAANAGDTIHVSAQTEANSVPALAYHWDFGDGITATGSHFAHTYTQAGNFAVRLTVDGVDGVPAVQTFTVNVTGKLRAFPNLRDNRRFREPTDH